MSTWWERLNDESTPISKYTNEASGWARCAVGETRRQHPGVIVTIGAEPEDRKMRVLGQRFYDAVYKDNFPRARQVYLMIQRRAVRLMQDSL